MLRLLHTADWHLGRRFPSFPEEGQKKLSRARMDVVSRILDVARRNAVNAVLCVGDIFDDPEPAADFWEGLARIFQGHAGEHPPLFLIPGNHDPLTQESVWAAGHPFRSRLPSWVHVVDRDDFIYEIAPNVELDEALVQTADRAAALESIRIRYARMTATAQSHAQDVLWEVLNAFEFFGEKNYVWALNLLLASTVAETNPNQLLPKLHRMARIMEPIGQTDMGVWIRHTLRAMAPGHWFGDKHDRLNYFRYPQISDTFQQELDAIFAKYKPLINVALTNALRLPKP